MINRTVTYDIEKSKKSILLLGPRQTGKSTLIKSFKPDLEIDLAMQSVFLQFAKNPDELLERLSVKKYKTVFIDEIQRLPELLNTIQSIIDNNKNAPKFYLTGSSARKLKRGKANLLPGRIHAYYLAPLTVKEINYEDDTNKILSYGLLPGIWIEKDKKEKSWPLNKSSSL